MDWFVPDEGVPFTFQSPKPTVEHVPESINRILLLHLEPVIAYALRKNDVSEPLDFLSEGSKGRILLKAGCPVVQVPSDRYQAVLRQPFMFFTKQFLELRKTHLK